MTDRLRFLDLRENAEFSVTSPSSAGTEFSIEHGLGRIPTGYFIKSQDGPGSLYISGTAWTNRLVYFKTDGTNVTFVVTFI